MSQLSLSNLVAAFASAGSPTGDMTSHARRRNLEILQVTPVSTH
ncbi:hypothetical protein RV134_390178 [Roseovarius sp. EC-HK134]|nr:hypothetical protein RV134_390178 [Roseovarius sp. EC-HK134]